MWCRQEYKKANDKADAKRYLNLLLAENFNVRMNPSHKKASLHLKNKSKYFFKYPIIVSMYN